MYGDLGQFEVRFAQTDDEIRSAQRLRYEVFVEELGAWGPHVDGANRLEADPYDPVSRHLLLFDHAAPANPVVGTYRLLSDRDAAGAGGFYSETEFDLEPLRASGRRLLELGRSCLAGPYRGGVGMFLLWSHLAEITKDEGFEILFGTASFHGTDMTRLAGPLRLLQAYHLAPKSLRATARPEQAGEIPTGPMEQIDRKTALRDMPALIKAYLRLGGVVAEGCWLDHNFNTTDVLMILDTKALKHRASSVYTKRVGQ